MINLKTIKKQIEELDDIYNFFAACKRETKVHAKHWLFATSPLEKSLDDFMQQLAEKDKMTALHFSAGFARHAFADVHKKHLAEVKEIGFAFLQSEKFRDGEPIEKQLKNIEAWLKEPTEKNRKAVMKGIDPSRQMNIWEEDLFPPQDQMWLWIIEPTQLLSMAVVAGDSEARDDEEDGLPYFWSFKACVSRSALCSMKSVAQQGRSAEEEMLRALRKIGDALPASIPSE